MAKLDVSALIQSKYIRFYRYLIEKDIVRLSNLMDGSFTILNISNVRQTKIQFLQAIEDGTLAYYQCRHDKIIIDNINENEATLIGNTNVLSSLFVQNKSYLNLRMIITFIKNNDDWKMNKIITSTY